MSTQGYYNSYYIYILFIHRTKRLNLLSRGYEYTTKTQIELPDIKNTMSGMKNTLGGIKKQIRNHMTDKWTWRLINKKQSKMKYRVKNKIKKCEQNPWTAGHLQSA